MGRFFQRKNALAYLAIMCFLGGLGLSDQRTEASQPKESQIAYLRQGNIFLFDLTTRQTTQLTNDDNVVAIAWSPNGQRLAYEVMDSMLIGGGGTSMRTNSNIMTMDPNGTNRREETTRDVEAFPIAYSPDGTLYHVERTIEAGLPLNVIVSSDTADMSHPLYKEPGGLCHITDVNFYSNRLAVVSRDCGRNKNLATIDFSSGKEYYKQHDQCLTSAIWSTRFGIVAAVQAKCGSDANEPKIAFFLGDGTYLSAYPAPNAAVGSIDISSNVQISNALFDYKVGAEFTAVYGNDNGLWLVADNGDTSQISSMGGLPRWRPNSRPAPPADYPTEPYPFSMPSTGQPQANDLLAWGALVACIAIVAGLFLISRRRRKGGDGL